MKIFGKDLFKFGKKEKQETTLYDFARYGLIDGSHSDLASFVTYTNIVTDIGASTTGGGNAVAVVKKDESKNKKKSISPKRLFSLKSLNDNDFKIITNKQYLEAQIKTAKDKLALLKDGSKRERVELESIILRLKNRYSIGYYKKILEEFPHTSSRLINNVLSEHKHLRCKGAEAFVPDFPKEAIEAMKRYTNMCLKLCNKKPVFYVIADKKDFEITNKKRDPILLAQSPFGFFWQILGAWDKEMVHLGDL